MDMIAAWIETIDAQMVAALPQDVLARMPIRERIRSLVQFRLDAVVGLEEALRRALATMAMPQNAARSLKTGWHSADIMWRLAGDTATDYNHYTKRTILAGIYGATLAVFVGDDSEGKADTRAFLGRRIDGVMKFEKAKAKLLNSDRESFSLTRLLGRLRYPAR
jgi:ubiquinone biosynthesis protein COQ9